MSEKIDLELDFLNYPTAFAIQAAGGLQHDSRCSSVPSDNPLTGPAFLCDCKAVRVEWSRLRMDRLKSRVEAAEAENTELRKMFPAILQALCNGSFCTETSSLNFLKGIPKEMAAVVDEHRAEIAAMRNKLEFYAGGSNVS